MDILLVKVDECLEELIYLAHVVSGNVPGPVLGDLARGRSQHHYSSAHVDYYRRRLAKGLELSEVSLVKGIEGLSSCLQGWFCFSQITFTLLCFLADVFIDLGNFLLLSISNLLLFADLLLLHSDFLDENISILLLLL